MPADEVVHPSRDGLVLAAPPWNARVPRARQINMAACSSHSEGELDRTHPATMSQGQGREGQDAEDPHVVWNDRRSAEFGTAVSNLPELLVHRTSPDSNLRRILYRYVDRRDRRRAPPPPAPPVPPAALRFRVHGDLELESFL